MKATILAAFVALAFTTGFTCSKNQPAETTAEQPAAPAGEAAPAAAEAAPADAAAAPAAEAAPADAAAAPATEAAPAAPAGQ